MSPMAVAVVSYDAREHLRACLLSILREDPSEIVVVNNGSTDGSIDLVREEFPSVTPEVDPSNRGYGAVGNRAFARSRAQQVG